MMKTPIQTLISIVVVSVVCLSPCLFFSGYESADSYTINVSPAYSDVSSVNQSVRLTATGWSDYTWALSNTDIGYLTSTHGESVTYVAKEIPISTSTTSTTVSNSTPTYTLQTITVTAKGAVSTTTTSDGTNTTSTTSEVYTGKAIVRHVGG